MSLLPALSADDPVSTPPRGPRLAWIEHLRGLAVLLVLGQHVFANALPGMERYLNLGLFGVVIFFLVSGFVISYSAMGLRQRAGLVFPIARVFRLYPVYWLSLALAAAMLHPGVRLLAVNSTMLQRLLGSRDLLGVYWTLEVELLFYSIVELLLLTRQIKRFGLYPVLAVGFTLLTLGMGYVRWRLNLRTPMAPPAGLAVMFFGACFFLHRRQGYLRGRTLVALGVGMYAVLAVAFLLGYRRDWGYDEHPLPFLVSYLLAAAVFFSFAYAPARPLRGLTFLGRISYPVYLFHVPLLDLGARWLPNWIPNCSAWVQAPVAIAAIFVLAVGLHYGVEDPGIRLGKRLVRRVVG